MRFDKTKQSNVYDHLKSIHGTAVNEIEYLKLEIKRYNDSLSEAQEKEEQLMKVLSLLEKNHMDIPF